MGGGGVASWVWVWDAVGNCTMKKGENIGYGAGVYIKGVGE